MALEDLYIDQATGDVALDDAGNVLFIEGADRVRQQLWARLSMQKTSWFRDLRVGVDWIGVVFGVGRSDTEIRAEIVREALEVPGVARVTSVTISRGPDGIVSITLEAQTADGIEVGGTVT